MSPSDYEMIEQGYDPPRMTHPLERVEEIVARIEAGLISYPIEQYDIRALIASWRERGADLQAANGYAGAICEVMRAKCEAIARDFWIDFPLSHIADADVVLALSEGIADAIAALKDKP